MTDTVTKRIEEIEARLDDGFMCVFRGFGPCIEVIEDVGGLAETIYLGPVDCFEENPEEKVAIQPLGNKHFARLSAPGYTNATDWVVGDTALEVLEDLDRMYGNDG